MKIEVEAARAIKLVAPSQPPQRSFKALLEPGRGTPQGLARPSGPEAPRPPQAAQRSDVPGGDDRAFGFGELGMFGQAGALSPLDEPPTKAPTLALADRAEHATPQRLGFTAADPAEADAFQVPPEAPSAVVAEGGERAPTRSQSMPSGANVVSAPSSRRFVAEAPPAAPAARSRGAKAQEFTLRSRIGLLLAEADGEIRLVAKAGDADGADLAEALKDVLAEHGLDLAELLLDGEVVVGPNTREGGRNGDHAD